MGAADHAQTERVGSLQELVERISIEDAARLLGMTAADVEDELRVDRAAE
jgi:predicted HTH domain antitoxin